MYTVVFTEYARKAFSKFDPYIQKMLRTWIRKNLQGCNDPRAKGKQLSENRSGQWRYRVGDYRIIVYIKDNELLIMVIAIGHRKNIY